MDPKIEHSETHLGVSLPHGTWKTLAQLAILVLTALTKLPGSQDSQDSAPPSS